MRLTPDDFEIERTEHLTRSSTVLMLDLSMSMPMEGQLPAGEEGGDGAALAHQHRSSRATTSASSGSPRRRGSHAGAAPGGRAGTSCTARTCTTRSRSPATCSPVSRAEADHHDHRRRADRAHHARWRGVLQLPAGAARPSRRRCARWCGAPGPGSASTRSCSMPRLAEGVRRADHGDQPRPGVLHHARDPRRLRAGRLHRAQAAAVAVAAACPEPGQLPIARGSARRPCSVAHEMRPCANVMWYATMTAL